MALMAIMLVRALRSRARLRSADPARRVVGAWDEVLDGLLLAGRPLSEVQGWLNMLAVYDVVFVVLAILLFPATVNE
jgi:uncharacterized membrane protein